LQLEENTFNSFPEKGRLLWIAGMTLFVVGVLGGLWAGVIWEQYWQYLPRSANPATGNVYPLNYHGIILYQTLLQSTRLSRWENWSTATGGYGVILGVIHYLRSQQRCKKGP
jgi:hypothetical protein